MQSILMSPLQTAIHNEHIPPDNVGRLIYVAKLFGPTAVLAGVMLWQGVRMIDALQEERKANAEFQRGQTEKVVTALVGSTTAINNSVAESQANRQALQDSIRILERAIEK